MTLEYSIINQKITSSSNNYYVVADSVNYLKIDFQFTHDWQGVAKLITFRNGQSVFTIPLDENDSCVVPWEVIKTPSFIFSLVGSKDGMVITTDTMKIVVRASGDQDGCDPKAPTKQFWEELGGGKANQILQKESDADYDYTWGDLKDASYDGEHTFEEAMEEKVDKTTEIAGIPIGDGISAEDLSEAIDFKVDDEFSTESENPVQNKVITNKINEIEETIDNLDVSLNRTQDVSVSKKMIKEIDNVGTLPQVSFDAGTLPSYGEEVEAVVDMTISVVQDDSGEGVVPRKSLKIDFTRVKIKPITNVGTSPELIYVDGTLPTTKQTQFAEDIDNQPEFEATVIKN